MDENTNSSFLFFWSVMMHKLGKFGGVSVCVASEKSHFLLQFILPPLRQLLKRRAACSKESLEVLISQMVLQAEGQREILDWRLVDKGRHYTKTYTLHCNYNLSWQKRLLTAQVPPFPSAWGGFVVFPGWFMFLTLFNLSHCFIYLSLAF